MNFRVKTLEELRAEKRQAAAESDPAQSGMLSREGEGQGERRDKKVVLVRQVERKITSKAIAQSEEGGVKERELVRSTDRLEGAKRGVGEAGPLPAGKRIKLSKVIMVAGEERGGGRVPGRGGAVIRLSRRGSGGGSLLKAIRDDGGGNLPGTGGGREERHVNSTQTSVNATPPDSQAGGGSGQQHRRQSLAELKTEM